MKKIIYYICFFILYFVVKAINIFSQDAIFEKKHNLRSFYILHGFVNYRALYSLITLTKQSNKELKYSKGESYFSLSVFHILWQLAKINFFYKKIIDNHKSWFLSFKTFGFEYRLNNVFNVCDGHIKSKENICCFYKKNTDPNKHICILSRISIFSVDIGLEFNYKKNNLKFNKHYFGTSIAGGISFWFGLPDIIIRYCPFVYSYKNNFYLRVELVQFSVLNLISSILIHKYNKEKDKSCTEEILCKGVLQSILFNIKIEIGTNI